MNLQEFKNKHLLFDKKRLCRFITFNHPLKIWETALGIRVLIHPLSSLNVKKASTRRFCETWDFVQNQGQWNFKTAAY